MKFKIAILGSTGSIGKSLLRIVSRNNNKIKISLLTANKNYKLILNQANKYNVKKIIITNKKYCYLAKSYNKNNSIKIYNDFNNLNKFFNKKIDYVMNSIVGINGLIPTFKIIKFTKKIAIANKETIICAWNLINKELKKHKTQFIPVDSEHFSIWYALKNNSIKNVERLFLTASGGPLLNIPSRKIKNYNVNKIIKHPNWKMGKKISVDSSTMINKVFEIIEAKKIFNLNYDKLSIIIHPKSYIHAILKFNDGMIKIIAHDTTMEIPILNTLNPPFANKIKTKKLDLNKLNNLKLTKVDVKKYPLTKLINLMPSTNSLFETVLVSANDELVQFFLEKKISYSDLIYYLLKILHKKEFIKYKFVEPKKITDILKLNRLIKSKIHQYEIFK